jgi:hypothetical protein
VRLPFQARGHHRPRGSRQPAASRSVQEQEQARPCGPDRLSADMPPGRLTAIPSTAGRRGSEWVVAGLWGGVGTRRRWGASWRPAVVPLLIWLLLTAAGATGVLWQQQSSRQSVVQRFQLRVGLAGDFVTTYTADLIARERVQANASLADRSVTTRDFARAVAGFGYPAAVLLDSHGRVLPRGAPDCRAVDVAGMVCQSGAGLMPADRKWRGLRDATPFLVIAQHRGDRLSQVIRNTAKIHD